MKKTEAILICYILIVIDLTKLFGGSVDYLSNQSPGYLRVFAKSAATNSIDGVLYNPAGITKNRDGVYLSLGNQFVFKDYSQETTNHEVLSATNPTLLLPSLISMLKKNKFAGFLAFGIPAGGGELEYEDGISAFNKYMPPGGEYGPHALLKSVYYGMTLGGAYGINDMFSFSIGIRGIIGRKHFKIWTDSSMTGQPDQNVYVLYSLESGGVGGIFGVNFTPVEMINIGIRYETVTKLAWETDVEYQGYKDMGKVAVLAQDYDTAGAGIEKKDLPPRISAGIGVKLFSRLEVMGSFIYHMIKSATWKNYNGSVVRNEDYDNGYEWALGAEYQLIDKLNLSGGYCYTVTGGNSSTYSDFEMALDAHSVGFGGEYKILPGVGIELALAKIFYLDGTSDEEKTTYSKDISSMALSINWKLR